MKVEQNSLEVKRLVCSLFTELVIFAGRSPAEGLTYKFNSSALYFNTLCLHSDQLGVPIRHVLGIATFAAVPFQLDHDVCSNYGNWNYSAGIGNDPRENRKFNMIKQATDYDPQVGPAGLARYQGSPGWSTVHTVAGMSYSRFKHSSCLNSCLFAGEVLTGFKCTAISGCIRVFCTADGFVRWEIFLYSDAGVMGLDFQSRRIGRVLLATL